MGYLGTELILTIPFIGSHIYEILGYPVHKTLLGIRKNNLVVACKDFCDENTRLLEMRTLKNIHISEMNQNFNVDLHETDDGHLVSLSQQHRKVFESCIAHNIFHQVHD